MMDSQENALNQGAEEVKQQEVAVEKEVKDDSKAAETPTPETAIEKSTENAEGQKAEETQSPTLKVYNSKKDIVERIKEIAESDETPEKAEIDHLKTTFYKMHFAEREAQQKAFIDNGGDPEKYQVFPDEDEENFKASMSIIKEKRQKAFLELEEQKQENLKRKEAILEKLKTMATTPEEANKNFQEVRALQQEWKTIGFAPQKMNVKIFERFRAACDDFFGKKGEFFNNLKNQFAENAEKKKALVEKAQSLTDSTDWKATTDKFIALQKEWKTIGMVPRKQGDQLWNDFLAACNHFFEARNAAHADTRNEELENLTKKNEIIEKLVQLAEAGKENIQEEVHQLTEEFNAVGHVPFKEKDKVYKAYHEILDKLYKDLHINAARRRMDNFRNNLKKVADRGANALDNERGRLMRRYEQLKQEINTYENNLGFLNISSKKGNSLIDDMNRRIQKLKDDTEEIRQKIKAIDAENKD